MYVKNAILGLMLLSLGFEANADMDTCLDDFIVLMENESYQEKLSVMVNTFSETCEFNDQCPYTVDEELISDAGAVASSAGEGLEEIPPIEGNLEIFAAGFASDPTYIDYVNSCMMAKGEITCVDVTLLAEGIITPLDDLPVDVSVLAHALPLCLPPSCADEDLTALTENIVKESIKADPSIVEALSSNGIAVSTIDFFTIDLICGLSELDTCEFQVEEMACGVPNEAVEVTVETTSSASFKVAGSFAATLISVAGTMAAMQ